MITAFVIYGTVAFWPANDAQPIEQRLLPMRMTFDTQEECTSTLRRRIAEHIAATGVLSVRQDTTKAILCGTMQLSAHADADSDRRYREEVLGSVRGSSSGQNVLREFVK